MSSLSRVLRCQRNLQQAHLKALFDERILAIVIDQFYPRESAKRIAPELSALCQDTYPGPYSVRRLPTSFAESHLSPAKRREYYKTGKQKLDQVRQIFPEKITPIDHFKNCLQNAWDKGAEIAHFSPHHDEQMFSGLVRIVEPSGEGLVHRDAISEEVKASCLSQELLTRVSKIRAQFAANVYLQMPPEGGSLELWGRAMETAEFYRLAKGKYGVKKDILEAPQEIVQPQEGQCIVFRTDRLHRVARSIDGVRITISTFGGYCGDDQPLLLWS